mmetsp:Transcript_90215/g.150838  ORF Transcript_90215/g.150838 Transcript_90215/m.150838 type:complete len:82 (+) Transcript_90215:470-715(+)
MAYSTADSIKLHAIPVFEAMHAQSCLARTAISEKACPALLTSNGVHSSTQIWHASDAKVQHPSEHVYGGSVLRSHIRAFEE